MLEVLMYIFENYVEERTEVGMPIEVILSEMEREGFSRPQILQAIEWFSSLGKSEKSPVASLHQPSLLAIRNFTQEEMGFLGMAGANFLLYLEKMSILDCATRELVLDRMMALGYKEAQLFHLKWVVLMVLFNHPEKKDQLHLLQDLILQDALQDEKKH